MEPFIGLSTSGNLGTNPILLLPECVTVCPEEPQVCVEPLMPVNPSMAGLRCCWLCPPVCECAASLGLQQAEHTELLSVSMGGLCGAAELGGCCKGGKREHFGPQSPWKPTGHLCVLYSQIHQPRGSW